MRDIKRIVDKEREFRLRDSRILAELMMTVDELGVKDLSGSQRRLFPDLMAFYERDHLLLQRMVDNAQIAVVLQDRAKKRNAGLIGLAAGVGAIVGQPLADLAHQIITHVFH